MSDSSTNTFRDQAAAAADAARDLNGVIEQLCDSAHAALEAVERDRVELALARDIVQAKLDGEIHNRLAVAAELQAVNEKLLHVKADNEALRLQLHGASERIRVLETRPRSAASPASPSAPASAEDVCAALDRLAGSLNAISDATTGSGIIAKIVEVFGRQFSRVVLCGAESHGFTVWRSRGFDPPLQRNTALRVAADSPLARAAAEWKPASAQSTAGVLGSPARFAIAVPIVARGRGTAFLYAENPPEAPNEIDDRVAARIVEILAEFVRSRLQIKPTPSTVGGTAAAKQRQAPRVKMLDGTTVVVDDAEGTLVDLSALGAQVLSPRAMRPNSPVRIVLPSDVGAVACTGRVVWVIVEQQPTTKSALYRAGVEFTDAKRGELEGYLSFFDSGIRH